MLRARYVLPFLFFVTVGGGAGIAWKVLRNGDESTRARIETVIEKSAGGTIDLAKIAPTAWDALYVFPAGTSGDRLRARGMPAFATAAVGLDRRDDVTLLLFLDRGEYRGYISFRKAKGDFTPSVREEPYARAEARFLVRAAGEKVELAPAP